MKTDGWQKGDRRTGSQKDSRRIPNGWQKESRKTNLFKGKKNQRELDFCRHILIGIIFLIDKEKYSLVILISLILDNIIIL